MKKKDSDEKSFGSFLFKYITKELVSMSKGKHRYIYSKNLTKIEESPLYKQRLACYPKTIPAESSSLPEKYLSEQKIFCYTAGDSPNYFKIRKIEKQEDNSWKKKK
uniref:hypothetical protein n=1 Tax=Roseburia hominis TaxID=301301 RepID=UPI001F36EEE1